MDHYYKIGDTRIHWVQLIVSIGFIILLTLIVFAMLKRGLKIDAKNLSAEALSRAERRRARITGAMEI